MITLFSISTGTYCPGPQYRWSLQDWCDDWGQYSRYRSKKQLLLCLLPGYFNQREIELFKFSRETDREDLNIRKNDVTLQWLYCNAYVYKQSYHHSSRHMYSKISTFPQGLLSQWKYSISCTNFFIMATEQ